MSMLLKFPGCLQCLPSVYLSSIQPHLFALIRKRVLRMSSSDVGQQSATGVSKGRSTQVGFRERPDAYGGVIVESDDNPGLLAENFEAVLSESLDRWKASNVKGVWFKVSLEHSTWIPVLTKNGFDYHHAKPGHAMLVRWLPVDRPNPIPNFAHTYISVGAVVVDEDGNMLTVKDRVARFKMWKLPGGYVDPGESLPEAAEREVKEETGVSAEFESVLAFRHCQHGAFDSGDIYFICLLRATSTEIKMCEAEIEACEWMKISDFMANKEVSYTNRSFVRCYLDMKRNGCIQRTRSVIQNWNMVQDIYAISPPQ